MPPARAPDAQRQPPPPGIAARLVEFGEELRTEGVGSGTAELLDAFAVLEQIPWTEPEDFREALAATLAKSPEDRRVFELVFERFFFRAAEAAAIRENVREGGAGDGVTGDGGEVDLDMLRQQLAAALREGTEGSLRDLARLAIAAFGRQGEGSGVIGVDVQRIRRTLGLRSEKAGAELPDPDAVPRDRLQEFERHVRAELE
ncbi:MAG: CoxE, partial [Solirubrobacteraceae bacterium]